MVSTECSKNYMASLEDRILRILEGAQLLSGAWIGIKYADLPEDAQKGIDVIVLEVKSCHG